MKNSNYNMRILLYSLLVFLISCNEDAQPKFEVEGDKELQILVNNKEVTISPNHLVTV